MALMPELPSAGERLRSNREAARRASERRSAREQAASAAPRDASDVTGFTPVTASLDCMEHNEYRKAVVELRHEPRKRLFLCLLRRNGALMQEIAAVLVRSLAYIESPLSKHVPCAIADAASVGVTCASGCGISEWESMTAEEFDSNR